MVVFLISLFTGSTISLAIADSSAEVDIIEGKQPVYSFIIGVE